MTSKEILTAEEILELWIDKFRGQLGSVTLSGLDSLLSGMKLHAANEVSKAKEITVLNKSSYPIAIEPQEGSNTVHIVDAPIEEDQ